MAVAGSIVWPGPGEPLWRFNWRLADSPDEEGVVISSALYRDRQVFYKASLPSLRVQYDGPCGPYKDPLNYNNSQTTTRCPTARVCVYSYVSAGVRGLSVESYHRIGAYRLTHRWVFWEDGQVYPRLWSAGLQCNYNHRHHAYWRFDFDIEGSADDQLLEYNTYNGWQTLATETSTVKYPPSRRSWAVMNRASGRGYHIYPGPNDGQADTFSNRDLWALRYQASEDRSGRQGTAYDDGLAAYINGENINGQDLVVWYCGHLFHDASHGGDDWHSVGPDLVPFRWT
jgi:hypothetical protein